MKKGFSITINLQHVNARSFLAEEYDDVYFQSETFDFLLEGVLLNKRKLLQEYALADFETFNRELYLLKKEQIITFFEGEYRGFIFDKVRNKLFVFTNITSTQRVFYTLVNDIIFVDSDLKRLTAALNDYDIKAEPDVESIYQMLCFTNMPEDKTPVKNVKKLLDGHFLEIDISDISVTEKEYFNLSEVGAFNGEKNKAIDLIHEVFQSSVLLEYEKDTELGKNHLALLSGGLDSRVAMFYALKNNHRPENALCFSQSGYFDHTISEKIAHDFNIHYEFIPLDGGLFLEKIDELTAVSEGMVLYTGAIHVQHAMDHLQYENFALFHSGQIGDGVLGGFNTEPFPKKPSYFKIVEHQKYLPYIKDSLDDMMKRYETEELFLLRNVAYNRTVLGAHVLQQKAYQTSPFMTKDFLKMAISLPEAWKYNHQFYIEWINKHCKEATKYRWERTLLKPDAQWKTKFGDQIIKRGFKILNEKILKTPASSSMYPYQFYFESQKKIQEYYSQYYEQNIYRLSGYPELESDIKDLFFSNDFSSKSQAINILAIFKLFF